MKYIVLIGDGMADRPLQELGGLTPLKKASTPSMDWLARHGVVGRVRTIPPGLPAGSDVANLSILGYDPARYYSGRAPLEAASMGIELRESDVAYRCNLVTLGEGDGDTIMVDYSAGHISSEEARELIEAVGRELGTDNIRFYPGVSYRHLMVWANGDPEASCTPPHDITGRPVAAYLPGGAGAPILRRLIRDSSEILTEHRVNKERVRAGKRPANSLWFWGQGRRPSVPGFKEKYGITGSLISAVDLTKGLGIYAGFRIIDVPGATGYLDTNYQGKAQYAIAALRDSDLVYLHIEAPDEAAHNGNVRDKIRAIEDIDALVLGPVLRVAREEFPEFRILLMPDHATPIEVRTHTDDYIPFAMYDSGGTAASSGYDAYSEDIAASETVLTFDEGYTLMDFFLSREGPGGQDTNLKRKKELGQWRS